MIVIEGWQGNGIGKAIAEKQGYEFQQSRHKIFPDNESEVGLDAVVRGKEVTIVQSLVPPVQDKAFFELLNLANDARKQGATRVGAVVPYMAYERQDKKLPEKDVASSIETVLELMNSVGISFLIRVAPHNPETYGVYNGRVEYADWITPVANAVKSELPNPYVLAPDAGAIQRAGEFARQLNCGYSNIEKHRDRITGKVEIVKAPEANFAGKDVLLVDDMIDSGGTVALGTEFLLANGAKKVVVAAAHLLMTGNAKEKLDKAGVAKLFGTNTIPYPGAQIVDLSKEIGGALSELTRNR